MVQLDDRGVLAEPDVLERPVSAIRRRIERTVSVLAFVVVWCALVTPDRLDGLGPAAFLRIPLEGLVLVVAGLFLPTRARRIVAMAAGVLIGLLCVVKLLDMGFHDQLNRPFNPVTDWGTFKPALGVLRDSVGVATATAAVVAAVCIVVVVVVGVAFASARVSRVTSANRRSSGRAVGALTAVALLALVSGLELPGGRSVASASSGRILVDHARATWSELQDGRAFHSALAAANPYDAVAPQDLLSGLRGKDVIVAFVESYGEVAVQGSSFAPDVDAALARGTSSLQAAGYRSSSAFLVSPTFGGISWLAHSTFQSGLWVDSQQRYNQLVASNRFTLSDAFKRAGWRTVADVPSNTGDWPQGRSFYHYDQLYNAHNVGYEGPKFSYALMPDQFTLSAFQRFELGTGHAPVMAEIDLVSSHTPWTPLPQMIDPARVGTGSVYNSLPTVGGTPTAVWRHARDVRAMYAKSIVYSIDSLVSFVRDSRDPNLVLVLLGDHQPATIVTGPDASHKVPITVIAHDPAVLQRIASWGWVDGLQPGRDAPTWRMDEFRDRFLTAFTANAPTLTAK